MAREPAGSGKAEGPGRPDAASPVTLATVLSRLAGELADLRATHAAEQALAERLGRERAAALDDLARTRAEEAALDATLAEVAAREAALRRELEAGRVELAGNGTPGPNSC
jgi:septal ring factor EnvC (AmiA/AmiB activator)